MFGPTQIRNPNIINDITAFFGLELGLPKIEKLVSYLSVDSRNKLFKVTERFEFVTQLLTFRNELRKRKKKNTEFFKEPNVFLGISVIEKIKMFGEKFDGVDYDIEALSLYLLLTCVDTIAGKEKYLGFSEWLSVNQKISEDECIDLDWIKNKEDEYKAAYGIGRRFKELLNYGLSKKLKNDLVQNFVVARLDNGSVNKDSWKAWKTADDSGKLKKIVNVLFEQIRNKYTHSSHRTFIPCVPVKFLRKTDFPVLLSLSNEKDKSKNLILILQNIVRCLVKEKILLNN